MFHPHLPSMHHKDHRLHPLHSPLQVTALNPGYWQTIHQQRAYSVNILLSVIHSHL